jgi:hypothetical protein
VVTRPGIAWPAPVCRRSGRSILLTHGEAELGAHALDLLRQRKPRHDAMREGPGHFRTATPIHGMLAQARAAGADVTLALTLALGIGRGDDGAAVLAVAAEVSNADAVAAEGARPRGVVAHVPDVTTENRGLTQIADWIVAEPGEVGIHPLAMPDRGTLSSTLCALAADAQS